MTDKKLLPPAILAHIAQSLNVPLRGLSAVIELLDDGGTVPFIARYRKEATGNLDEVQIRAIEEKLAYFRELEERRETILASILMPFLGQMHLVKTPNKSRNISVLGRTITPISHLCYIPSIQRQE